MSLYPAQRRRLRSQSNAVLAAVKRLQADLGRPITHSEIEAETWFPPEQVTARLQWLEERGDVIREDGGWLVEPPKG